MRVLFGADHEHFGRLTDEWIQVYNQGKAAKTEAERIPLRQRIHEINLEQEAMLEKAKQEQIFNQSSIQ